jgi:bla regulator protein blaR1
VELRRSPECPVAMTWGTWRPVVMLPADAAAWSEERLELVLRHELAHVARRDCLVRLLSQVACALYWPNPLVWLAARRLRLAQEQACDDRVLAAGGGAETYATELLAVAKALSGRRWRGEVMAMAEPSTLEKRIVSIVDEGRDRGVARSTTVALAATIAALVLTGCAVQRVREGEPVAVAGRAAPRAEIELLARVVEFKADAPEAKAVLAEFRRMAGYLPASGIRDWLSPEEVGAFLHDLGKRVGGDLLSLPKARVVTGQAACITLGQELRYPKTGTDISGVVPLSSADFESRNLGLEIEAVPLLGDDGRIELRLKARNTRFEGFVTLPSGPRTAPAPDGATAAPGTRLPGALAAQPIFATLEVNMTERIKPGRSVMVQLGGETGDATPLTGGSLAAPVNPGASGDKITLVILTATPVPRLEAMAGDGAELAHPRS